MSGNIAVFDTSLLCCWLRIPGRERAGSGANSWDWKRVDELVKEELDKGSTIVLPLATIIETGNYISQSPNERFKYATEFSKHLKSAVQSELPWAAFTEQSILWSPERLLSLAEEWPRLADAKMSIGDATIKHIADYYAEAGFNVRILTSDEALLAYEPRIPKQKPRRRM
jgi:hypothetical protein